MMRFDEYLYTLTKIWAYTPTGRGKTHNPFYNEHQVRYWMKHDHRWTCLNCGVDAGDWRLCLSTCRGFLPEKLSGYEVMSLHNRLARASTRRALAQSERICAFCDTVRPEPYLGQECCKMMYHELKPRQ